MYINHEINALNDMLEGLSKNEENLIYIDNETGIMDESNGMGRADLYTDTVHLNPKGRVLLKNNISDAIREGYSKNGLRVQWDITPKT